MRAALFNVVAPLIGPLLRTLRLPQVPAIIDIGRELKELATFGALKLMKKVVFVSLGPWRSVLKLFERTITVDESQAAAARFSDQTPYKRNIVCGRFKRALFSKSVTAWTHNISMPDLDSGIVVQSREMRLKPHPQPNLDLALAVKICRVHIERLAEGGDRCSFAGDGRGSAARVAVGVDGEVAQGRQTAGAA